MPATSNLKLIGIGAIGATAVIVIGSLALSRLAKPTDYSSAPSANICQAEEKALVSDELYQQCLNLKVGMSKGEVDKILGVNGHQWSTQKEFAFVEYKDRSTDKDIDAVFFDGKLSGKKIKEN